MSKYIDADRLIHDLEERIYAYSEGYADGDDCRKDAIETLLKDIKYQCSLQQEQQEVDLEKEYKEYVQDDPVFSKLTNRYVGISIAKHFYELGQLEMRHRITNPEYNAKVVEQLKSEYPAIKEE